MIATPHIDHHVLEFLCATSIMGTTVFETLLNVIKYFMVEIDRLFFCLSADQYNDNCTSLFSPLRTRELALFNKWNLPIETKNITTLHMPNNEVNPICYSMHSTTFILCSQ